MAASFGQHHDVVLCLLLQGAANDDKGHVDLTIINRDLIVPTSRAELFKSAEAIICQHETFIHHIVPAVTAE